MMKVQQQQSTTLQEFTSSSLFFTTHTNYVHERCKDIAIEKEEAENDFRRKKKFVCELIKSVHVCCLGEWKALWHEYTFCCWMKCESVWQSDWNNEKQFVCSNRASGFLCLKTMGKDTRNNVERESWCNQVNRFLSWILFLATPSFNSRAKSHACFPHCHSALLAFSYQNDFYQFDVI